MSSTLDATSNGGCVLQKIPWPPMLTLPFPITEKTSFQFKVLVSNRVSKGKEFSIESVTHPFVANQI